ETGDGVRLAVVSFWLMWVSISRASGAGSFAGPAATGAGSAGAGAFAGSAVFAASAAARAAFASSSAFRFAFRSCLVGGWAASAVEKSSSMTARPAVSTARARARRNRMGGTLDLSGGLGRDCARPWELAGAILLYLTPAPGERFRPRAGIRAGENHCQTPGFGVRYSWHFHSTNRRPKLGGGGWFARVAPRG